MPLAFSAVIGLLFVVYTGQLFATGANLSNLSVWGLIFALNTLGVLGVIIAFWIEVNLVNTLWILLGLSPVTLFVMNKGLTPANCHISEFNKKVKTN